MHKLLTNINFMSLAGSLKEFIEKDHWTENQKHHAVSSNMERFIWAKEILEVSINQVSLRYIVMRKHTMYLLYLM